MRAIGLDLGAARIGVAVSDPAGSVATPHSVLQRGGGHDADHRRVAALVAEYEADLVVVGLPRSLDGGLGPAARAALDEVDELAAVLGVPVETVDERLTTITAERLLREAGITGKARRAVVDQVAASVLLQSWLDGRAAGDDAAGAEAGRGGDRG